jgi:hypothetical protein
MRDVLHLLSNNVCACVMDLGPDGIS